MDELRAASFLVLAALMALAIPNALFCVRPRVLRAGFEAGPEGVPLRASGRALKAVQALQGAGFEALGVKVEKTPLRPAARELAFVAADRTCYASIGLRRLRSAVYLYTPLPAGGLVLTSDGAFPRIASGRVIQRSYPGCGIDELLLRHRSALGSLGCKGEVIPTHEARLEATYAYYASPEIKTLLRRMGLTMGGMVALAALATLAW